MLACLLVAANPTDVLRFGKILRAAARAEHDADSRLSSMRHRFSIEAGIFQRFGRGADRQRHGARNVLAFYRVEPVKLR